MKPIFWPQYCQTCLNICSINYKKTLKNVRFSYVIFLPHFHLRIKKLFKINIINDFT